MLKIKESTIIVGLSLGESDSNLVQSAANLANKTQSRLILAHAILPFQAYSYMGDGILYPTSAYEAGFLELSEARTYSRLGELKSIASKLVSGQSEVSTRIIHSDPAVGLLNLADELNASLLICGFQADYVKNNFLGLSTAIALMVDSPRPVLALPLDRVFKFTGSLGIADDLAPNRVESIISACSFLKAANMKNLVHIHVQELSESEIQTFVESIKAAMLMNKIPDNPDFSEQFFKEKTAENLSQLLFERYQQVPEELRSDISYDSRIGFGSPVSQIKKLADDCDCELVVFGTHKFFDRSKWKFGKVPNLAMLSLNRGILLVPHSKKAQSQ